MIDMLSSLISRLTEPFISETSIIKWSCPIPSFGDLSRSRVATLGLNPSNKEFVDESGNELEGSNRRFHTLKSLDLACWSDIQDNHVQLISDSCNNYFFGNPYDRWFRKLDGVICGTGCSYYSSSLFYDQACHLDLIPYATSEKWANLTSPEKSSLFEITGNALALLLRDSPIEVLILNGKTVVEQFQNFAGVVLERELVSEWTLPRKYGEGIAGIGYRGVIKTISNIGLDREVLVLGFNHNLQSSYGVSKKVTDSIRDWVTQHSYEVLT
jgi:hypothetical protein